MKKLITSVFLVFGLYSNLYSQKNPCNVDYRVKLGMDTLVGCCQWEEFTIRLGAYYKASSIQIVNLNEENWAFGAIAIMFEGDKYETWYSMCDAELKFGH
jgi:hypothetical protein